MIASLVAPHATALRFQHRPRQLATLRLRVDRIDLRARIEVRRPHSDLVPPAPPSAAIGAARQQQREQDGAGHVGACAASSTSMRATSVLMLFTSAYNSGVVSSTRRSLTGCPSIVAACCVTISGM